MDVKVIRQITKQRTHEQSARTCTVTLNPVTRVTEVTRKGRQKGTKTLRTSAQHKEL